MHDNKKRMIDFDDDVSATNTTESLTKKMKYNQDEKRMKKFSNLGGGNKFNKSGGGNKFNKSSGGNKFKKR